MAASPSPAQYETGADGVPVLPREFRGMWITTVLNLDWPSRAGLPVEQQKRELAELIDEAAATGLNAIVFQVRSVGDAMYPSETEPWSGYLTGELGRAPEPMWDPLAFAIERSHAHGMELHAWMNPFRASHVSTPRVFPESHVSKRHPEIVLQYGRYKWLNPAMEETHEYFERVLVELLTNYDVDGVQFDDYFYQYAEKDADGNPIEFPDIANYEAYRGGGGTMSLLDWRRDNVNRFIKRMHDVVREQAPMAKYGISPFGIWKPGQPEGIRGLNAYDALAADARLWLQEGWVDYLAPQLYWPTTAEGQDYRKLQDWWAQQNSAGRHLWIGNALYKVSDFGADEYMTQLSLTRAHPGVTGNIHFRMQNLLNNPQGVRPMLADFYGVPALVPASPWLDRTPPPPPRVSFAPQSAGGTLSWQMPEGEEPRFYVVYLQEREPSNRWHAKVLPGSTTAITSAQVNWANTAAAAISAIDKAGNESSRALTRF